MWARRWDRNRGRVARRVPRQACRQRGDNCDRLRSEYAPLAEASTRAAEVSKYPEIKVEINTDYRLTDLAAERFDLGVRFGRAIAKRMIAVRIGPDVRMTIVGAPSYLYTHPAPKTPQELTRHNCIQSASTHLWWPAKLELRKGRTEQRVRVEGQVTFNGTYHILAAALDGFGLAYIPEDLAKRHVRAGSLAWVLEDWFPTFPGHHLYHPSRRQSSKALGVVIEALRHQV